MAKVLIVEDEKAIVDIIAFNLKREGYQVEEAYEGKGGLEKALSPQVDLVLLDVMLPGMDGFELLRRLRDGADLNANPGQVAGWLCAGMFLRP